jgi:hypothetical protein
MMKVGSTGLSWTLELMFLGISHKRARSCLTKCLNFAIFSKDLSDVSHLIPVTAGFL